MIKKLKCWIIHLLGGYTEKELIEEVDKGVKVCNDDANEALELAMYWHQRYTAEHEAYLALLNCHNATAEAAQQNNASGVAGAIGTIKAYCKSKDFCFDCALHDEKSGCKVHEIPCYWGG